MPTIRTASKARRLGACLAAIAVVITACSSSSKKTSTGGTGTTASGQSQAALASAALQKAITMTATAEKGTNRPVDPTSRPAAKGKHVIVISQGQSVISSMIPSDGAVAAAKAIGWKVDLYDAQVSPAKYAPLIRQAIAAGADGIVVDAIDCDNVVQPLQEAKARGIVVIGIYAFDCSDSHGGGMSQNLFSAQINFGPKAANIDAFTESYGADQANYIIAASGNKAKIIVIQDPEFVVLYWTLKGFEDTINASHGSQVIDTLNVTTSDILTGKLVAKIQAELLRFPQATWIKSPYTYVTTLGIAPALGARAGQIGVMGGEGFNPELDLIRQGKITAVNIISSTWTGWAAIDTMNSVFLKQKPVDSGIGWTIADKTHNLPASGEFSPPVDFMAAYKKAWGVGG